MLTLEQVSAVNDGFHRGDLNAALQPLEETIDLRANELPRLDKHAVAALKDGLQNGDDAATWAQANLHPNISVRRFARKVFLGMGDEAAPIFAPLRARLERFWNEEEPLPESNKPREAALRREQNEQVSSALEILLRTNPEKFMEFYAQLVDVNSAQGRDPQAAITEWHRLNTEAVNATNKEVNRLLKAEWGEDWMKTGKRYKLPTRVLLELDAKARQKPEIAAIWAERGDYSEVAGTAQWNIVALLDGARGAYLHAEKPSAPTKRVNARLQPVLMRWLEGAFDWQTTPDERGRMARRFLQNNYGQTTGGLNIEELPGCLLRNKARLERPLQKLMASEEGYHAWISREGDDLLALLWLYLAMGLSRYLGRLHGFNASSFETPAMEPAVLRQIIEGLPQTWVSRMVLDGLESGAKAIEQRRKSANASEVAEAMPINVVEVVRARAAGLTLQEAEAQIREEEATRNREMLALDADARIARLVDPTAESGSVSRLPQRLTIWNVMAHSMGGDGFALVKKELWPRAEPLLWARFETQLEAHRRVETEPIEPGLEQKLTPAEIKQWQTRARQEKRQWIANDIDDIAALMAQVDGLAARLKSVELTNRPACREIHSRLKADLFVELQQLPQGYNFRSVKDASVEAWENWKLDQSWDEVLADAELDLSQAKDEWARNTLSRQLAVGYYRRGKLAQFERHATRPEAFPFSVAAVVVHSMTSRRGAS